MPINLTNVTPELDRMPNALEIAEYQYCTIAYDFRVHPEADKQIQLLMKQLYAATRAEVLAEYQSYQASEHVAKCGG